MGSHFNGLSLGLSYIAAVLSKNGHEVKIYNADYVSSEKYANLRTIFEEYEGYKKILSNLDGFDIEKIEMDHTDSNDNYIFKHLDEDSIFKELIKNENFMIDIISRVIDHTDKDLIKSLWKGENSEDYFDTFKWLLDQEHYRINLLKPFTGTTERIV